MLSAIERAELLIAAARANAAANDITTATRLCGEAADLALYARDPQLLGHAALVLPGVSDLTWLTASRQWCEEALRGLDDGDSRLRTMLLAHLCHTMALPDPDTDGMDRTSAQALAMAERLDDRESLVSALRARQLARSGADGHAERTELGARMLALGTATGDTDAVLWGRIWRFDAFMQAGRIADAERELDLLEPVAAGLRRPLARLHLIRSRGGLAFGRGNFTETARLNDEVIRIAQDGGHTGAVLAATSVRNTLNAFAGRSEGIEWLAAAAEKDNGPFTAMMTSALAVWLIEIGRETDAQRCYDRLPPVDLRRIPPFLVIGILFQRALLTDLGDAATAELCHRLLLPYADMHAVGGAGAITTGGSVQLYLGTAALGAGRPDAATRHLRAAITANEAVGFAPFAAMSRYRLAAALRARARPADNDEAVALLAAADSAAKRMGMAPLREQIAALSGNCATAGCSAAAKPRSPSWWRPG